MSIALACLATLPPTQITFSLPGFTDILQVPQSQVVFWSNECVGISGNGATVNYYSKTDPNVFQCGGAGSMVQNTTAPSTVGVANQPPAFCGCPSNNPAFPIPAINSQILVASSSLVDTSYTVKSLYSTCVVATKQGVDYVYPVSAFSWSTYAGSCVLALDATKLNTGGCAPCSSSLPQVPVIGSNTFVSYWSNKCIGVIVTGSSNVNYYSKTDTKEVQCLGAAPFSSVTITPASPIGVGVLGAAPPSFCDCPTNSNAILLPPPIGSKISITTSNGIAYGYKVSQVSNGTPSTPTCITVSKLGVDQVFPRFALMWTSASGTCTITLDVTQENAGGCTPACFTGATGGPTSLSVSYGSGSSQAPSLSTVQYYNSVCTNALVNGVNSWFPNAGIACSNGQAIIGAGQIFSWSSAWNSAAIPPACDSVVPGVTSCEGGSSGISTILYDYSASGPANARYPDTITAWTTNCFRTQAQGFWFHKSAIGCTLLGHAVVDPGAFFSASSAIPAGC